MNTLQIKSAYRTRSPFAAPYRSGMILLFGFLTAFASAEPAFAQSYGGWRPLVMDGWGVGRLGGILMFVIWALIVVGLIFLIARPVPRTEKAAAVDASFRTSAAIHIDEGCEIGEIEKHLFQEKRGECVS